MSMNCFLGPLIIFGLCIFVATLILSMFCFYTKKKDRLKNENKSLIYDSAVIASPALVDPGIDLAGTQIQPNMLDPFSPMQTQLPSNTYNNPDLVKYPAHIAAGVNNEGYSYTNDYPVMSLPAPVQNSNFNNNNNIKIRKLDYSLSNSKTSQNVIETEDNFSVNYQNQAMFTDNFLEPPKMNQIRSVNSTQVINNQARKLISTHRQENFKKLQPKNLIISSNQKNLDVMIIKNNLQNTLTSNMPTQNTPTQNLHQEQRTLNTRVVNPGTNNRQITHVVDGKIFMKNKPEIIRTSKPRPIGCLVQDGRHLVEEIEGNDTITIWFF